MHFAFKKQVVCRSDNMPGLVDQIGAIGNRLFASRKQLSGIAFIDVEVGYADRKPHDFGSIRDDGRELHIHSQAEFVRFIEDAEFLCGHTYTMT